MKTSIRKQVREALSAMGRDEREAASKAVCRQVMQQPAWQQASTVLLYAALPDEVDLQMLIEAARMSSKRVVLPVIEGDHLRLFFRDECHLHREVRFGIEEPTAEAEELTDLSQIGLAVIPGRAFTPAGLRLGRGKGFYDRLLPQLSCPTLGVAFACQRYEQLPTDPWDVPLTTVVFDH